MVFFVKGIILGFSIAAPVGPIGIYCIRKTLQYGRASGLFSGLGAATADLIYGIIAAFGLTLVSDFLLGAQVWIRLIGGLFLIYLGGKTFFSKFKIENKGLVARTTLVKDFATTFFLTITNPMTILSFIAIFAGLGLAQGDGGAVSLVTGVFLGSFFWWMLLCEFTTLFRKKIEERMMVWINYGAGLIIFSFGVIALIVACLAFFID